MFVLVDDGHIINLSFVTYIYYTDKGITLYWADGSEETYTGLAFNNIMAAVDHLLFIRG